MKLEVFNVKDKLPEIPKGRTCISVIAIKPGGVEFTNELYLGGKWFCLEAVEYWAYMPTRDQMEKEDVHTGK